MINGSSRLEKKSKKSSQKPSQKIIYVYSTNVNKNYIQHLSTRLNITESEIVNKLIDAHKNNKKANFKKFVPLFVKRAEKWLKKRGHKEQREAL